MSQIEYIKIYKHTSTDWTVSGLISGTLCPVPKLGYVFKNTSVLSIGTDFVTINNYLCSIGNCLNSIDLLEPTRDDTVNSNGLGGFSALKDFKFSLHSGDLDYTTLQGKKIIYGTSFTGNVDLFTGFITDLENLGENIIEVICEGQYTRATNRLLETEKARKIFGWHSEFKLLLDKKNFDNYTEYYYDDDIYSIDKLYLKDTDYHEIKTPFLADSGNVTFRPYLKSLLYTAIDEKEKWIWVKDFGIILFQFKNINTGTLTDYPESLKFTLSAGSTSVAIREYVEQVGSDWLCAYSAPPSSWGRILDILGADKKVYYNMTSYDITYFYLERKPNIFLEMFAHHFSVDGTVESRYKLYNYKKDYFDYLNLDDAVMPSIFKGDLIKVKIKIDDEIMYVTYTSTINYVSNSGERSRFIKVLRAQEDTIAASHNADSVISVLSGINENIKVNYVCNLNGFRYISPNFDTELIDGTVHINYDYNTNYLYQKYLQTFNLIIFDFSMPKTELKKLINVRFYAEQIKMNSDSVQDDYYIHGAFTLYNRVDVATTDPAIMTDLVRQRNHIGQDFTKMISPPGYSSSRYAVHLISPFENYHYYDTNRVLQTKENIDTTLDWELNGSWGYKTVNDSNNNIMFDNTKDYMLSPEDITNNFFGLNFVDQYAMVQRGLVFYPTLYTERPEGIRPNWMQGDKFINPVIKMNCQIKNPQILIDAEVVAKDLDIYADYHVNTGILSKVHTVAITLSDYAYLHYDDFTSLLYVKTYDALSIFSVSYTGELSYVSTNPHNLPSSYLGKLYYANDERYWMCIIEESTMRYQLFNWTTDTNLSALFNYDIISEKISVWWRYKFMIETNAINSYLMGNEQSNPVEIISQLLTLAGITNIDATAFSDESDKFMGVNIVLQVLKDSNKKIEDLISLVAKEHNLLVYEKSDGQISIMSLDIPSNDVLDTIDNTMIWLEDGSIPQFRIECTDTNYLFTKVNITYKGGEEKLTLSYADSDPEVKEFESIMALAYARLNNTERVINLEYSTIYDLNTLKRSLRVKLMYNTILRVLKVSVVPTVTFDLGDWVRLDAGLLVNDPIYLNDPLNYSTKIYKILSIERSPISESRVDLEMVEYDISQISNYIYEKVHATIERNETCDINDEDLNEKINL